MNSRSKLYAKRAHCRVIGHLGQLGILHLSTHQNLGANLDRFYTFSSPDPSSTGAYNLESISALRGGSGLRETS